MAYLATGSITRQVLYMNEVSRIRDADPVNARIQDIDVAFAERRYEYLIAKRDQLQDRLRTGSLALNGGSLVALMTMLGNEGKVAGWIGLNAHNSSVSAACFALGVLLAGISIAAADRVCTAESSKAFVRYMTVRRLAATYEASQSPGGWKSSQEALEEASKAPLIDFEYSHLSIFSQNLSGGSWFVGIAVPLAASFGWT